MKLYHVTRPESVAAILKLGLRANAEGHIFALTDLAFVINIAQLQIFIPAFAVLKIAPKGITGKVGPDDVGELTAPWHRIIHQDVIKPKFLTVVVADFPTPVEYAWPY